MILPSAFCRRPSAFFHDGTPKRRQRGTRHLQNHQEHQHCDERILPSRDLRWSSSQVEDCCPAKRDDSEILRTTLVAIKQLHAAGAALQRFRIEASEDMKARSTI